MYDLIVVGGGAAGMMAAGIASGRGKKVLLLEKNAQLGRKIMITGKGRCNLTNDCETEEFIKNFPGNGKFLYSALYSFSNWQLLDFFSKLGVETKVERGGRVFPVSDSAKDIVAALKYFLREEGVEVKLRSSIQRIVIEDGKLIGVEDKDSNLYRADKVLIAVGGKAYPTTGSSGDGYEMAKRVGHKIEPIKPALVALKIKEEWVKELQSLQLRNVEASLIVDSKVAGSEFGEMLFTHFGVSGPIILTLSRLVSYNLGKDITLSINLKPALSKEKLDNRLQRDFEKYARKQFKNSLNDLLPSKLIPIVIELSSIAPEKVVHQITKEERQKLLESLTDLRMTVEGTLGFRDAIVTAGGINVDQVNPSTMESKLVKGLYFAGEVLDVDAHTGGYNLQGAFSMGHLVGSSV